MRFAVELPTMRVDEPDQFLSPPAVAEMSRAADAAGFDALYVTDHPAGDATWLDTGGHHALDPWVSLSFAAAATERIKLLTYVYIAAYRNPFLSAKAALSLHVLSGERLILGMAAGYLRPEFGALGVDFDERNELLEEAIDVMQRSWSGDDVAVEGRHFRARGVRMRPVPATAPPIWMGGNSTRALRRAVEVCDGWAPFRSAGFARASKTAEIDGLDDLLPRIELARRHAEEIGRSRPLDICYSADRAFGRGEPADELIDELGRYSEAGITWVTVGFPGHERAVWLDHVHRYAAEVMQRSRAL